MTGLLEQSVSGTFHTVSPEPPYGFGDLLEAIAARVAPPGTTLRWVDPAPLLAADLSGDPFPLWTAGEPELDGIAADPSAAIAAGLSVRPIEQTAEETWQWVRSTSGPPPGIGISPARETELLRSLPA
jgi:2'-hydroxyisoflavone reductase